MNIIRGNIVDRPTVSVAMAVYNGEAYLREQIDSIINQLESDDELIISYNKGTDDSLTIITEYQKVDDRITIVECGENGVISNFENAIRHCKKDIIFLSDQDDVWIEDKINKILSYFNNSEIGCVTHKATLVNENLEPIDNHSSVSKKIISIRPLNIIIKNQVQGCCMAFRKEYVKYILPIPRKMPMHDSWIGLRISQRSKVILIPDELILYRQHDNNVTSRNHQKVPKMIYDRLQLISCIFRG